MAITPLKLLLFLAGAGGAASGTAYVAGAFDPYLPPASVAALPADPAEAPAVADAPKADAAIPKAESEVAKPVDAAKSSEAGAADPAKPAEQKIAAADPAPANPTPDVATPTPTPPSFDLLRVEADGSIVIAGHAAPGSSVEIVTGSRVLGKVDAGPTGDFVAVLDEPLKPGDYQIVLRASGPGAIVLSSVETAVVSVPEDKNGQVLALVEQPGAPSKLITAPAAKPEPEKPAEVAAAPAQPDATASPPPATAQEAAAAPAEQPSAPPVSLGDDIKVAVEAVEIEGRKIFVAGAAPAGTTVRIYANDLLLGDARSSPESRFLLETERDLTVGDYIIRADVLSRDGSKVLARAAVPFEREPGESIAAVAPVEPAAAAAGPSEIQPADQAAKPADATTAPPPNTSAGVEVAGADSTTPAQPGTDVAVANAPVDPAKPQDKAAADPAQPAAPEKPADVAAGPTDPTTPAEAADVPMPAPAGEPANPVLEPTAPKLQAANGGVIIRRGDSLWRISKRVYGRGTRYSTIYVANKEQILNPDRIWPGQIFRVPEKSDKGENADMKAIGDQATTVQ